MKNQKNEMYSVVMNLITKSNYGVKDINIDLYTLSYLESVSKILINDDNHINYLFKIYDTYYSDEKYDEVL